MRKYIRSKNIALPRAWERRRARWFDSIVPPRIGRLHLVLYHVRQCYPTRWALPFTSATEKDYKGRRPPHFE